MLKCLAIDKGVKSLGQKKKGGGGYDIGCCLKADIEILAVDLHYTSPRCYTCASKLPASSVNHHYPRFVHVFASCHRPPTCSAPRKIESLVLYPLCWSRLENSQFVPKNLAANFLLHLTHQIYQWLR